jgi:hypothetical protein
MNETPLIRRRRRVKLIRGRVVAGSAALFIAAFGGIAAQLASGHDPSLSAKSSTTAAAPSTTTSSTSAATSSSTTQAASKPLSPVKTSQS